MMAGYSIALELSLLISIFISFIISGSFFINQSINNVLTLLIGVVLLIVFSIPIFLLIYPILNFLYQDFSSLDFIKGDITSGVLAIRFISIIVGLRFIMGIFSHLNEDSEIENNIIFNMAAGYSKLGYKEIDQLEEHSDTDQVRIGVIAQYCYYAYILVALWVFIMFFKITLILKIAIWVVFFIIDDWFIISDYYKALKGRMIVSHKIRVIASNVILFLLIQLSSINQIGWTGGVVHFLLGGIIGTTSILFMLELKKT